MGRVSDAKERLMKAVTELVWCGSYGSTTIDQICDKAGVKKGSFYYFFKSKSELAFKAIEESWKGHRIELDAIFSPTVPPLERLRKYCEYMYRIQVELQAEYGSVLGCPLFSIGSEVSTQEKLLQKKIQDILELKRKYLESAIRDAYAAGLITAPNAAAKSKILFAYYQGLLTEARIQNRVDVLKDACAGTYDLLGVKSPDTVTA